MSATSSIRSPMIYTKCISTSLVGESKLTSTRERLAKLERASNMVNTQTPVQRKRIRDSLGDAFLNIVNSDYRTQLKLARGPQEQISVTQIRTSKKTVGVLGEEARISYIPYEKSAKTYTSEETRQSWQSRINILEEAVSTRKIFSISIIPLDRSEPQTWYHQQSFSSKVIPPEEENEMWKLFLKGPKNSQAESSTSPEEPIFFSQPSSSEAVHHYPFFEEQQQDALTLIRGIIGESYNYSASHDVPDHHTGKSSQSSTRWKIQNSKEKETHESPAPTLSGFFSPFEDFSSSMVRPRYEPQNLPAFLNPIDVFSITAVEAAIAGLENDAIKGKIGKIAELFQEDMHATGLGLVILEPSRMQVKTLFFRK